MANLVKSNKKRRRELLARRVLTQVNYNHNYAEMCAVGIGFQMVVEAGIKTDFYNRLGTFTKFFGFTDDQARDLYWGDFSGQFLQDITQDDAAEYIRSV